MRTMRVDKRGAVVIPASLRRDFGLEEGSLVIAESNASGILLRPASIPPTERYSPKRRAEFLLSNAIDAEDYAQAREAVRAMGLDPDTIPHIAPAA